MVTTTEPHSTLQQLVVVTSNKVKANLHILKVASGGQGKGPGGKGKSTKLGRKNVVKPSTSKTVTSAGPSANPRDKI